MSSWCSIVLYMAKATRVLAALKRDGWFETRRSGSRRVLARGDQQRIWAYHDGVDLGGPAMARIARDYGYTLAELRNYRIICP
jgi:predicted RNA binding protein YcfA (HicA-like mRNA interferase family)